MVNLRCNTDIVRKSCNNIKNYNNDLKKNIDEVFQIISNLENKEAWVGGNNSNSAVRSYINLRMQNKEMFNDVTSSIDNFANTIDKNMKKIENIVKND